MNRLRLVLEYEPFATSAGSWTICHQSWGMNQLRGVLGTIEWIGDEQLGERLHFTSAMLENGSSGMGSMIAYIC